MLSTAGWDVARAMEEIAQSITSTPASIAFKYAMAAMPLV